ncbi:uncharacterized protein BT62DRAFT_1004366 [Guyanagaster necrorhizus]|uniref:Uncharacterized protein n=1 Tax=Guyanagaster necrorhizus TaxID=856835 RepID=A0A9P7VVD1_9AGAR|nr:uncharacterized protein BT62DRAFT_1004366 [Guyanagaster necrorhizus MCA 3950]KAG7447609.1 hypothetical protein BT62DRAFT_1004366 [Guyanagaster necrorhizus MCA 3950]
MPLKETFDTFTYFISELDKLKIAYVALVQWAEFLDPVIDSCHRATKHDVVATYSPLLNDVMAFANAGFTGEEAAHYILQGKVLGVFFGVSWIAHPDFAKRLQYGKSLDEKLDMSTIHRHGKDIKPEKKGYTDYPSAEY